MSFHMIGCILIAFGIFAALGYILIAVRILSCYAKQADNNPEYLLVLGARYRENGPSKALRYRLDAAKAYMEAHPKVKAVLSGGQGDDEPCTEAEGMRKYLFDIPDERFVLEGKSRTTIENIRNSLKLTGNVPVAVVTNNFHMYRALKLARYGGYTDVSGIAADSSLFYFPYNMTREVLAVIKNNVILSNKERKNV